MALEGQVLAGKYRLERLLGTGGFASVWAARQITLDRPVALKLLSDHLSRSKETVARFVREARLSARAIHPTIVRVEDIGETDQGVPFLVMELLSGVPLMAVMNERGALSLKEALALSRALLEGLAAAHALGVIHRDIKPGNIFLVDGPSPEQRVKILDLGLAKDAEGTQGLTRSETVMGTPDYLAPELFTMAQKHAWSAAADVFALGVVAYRLLSGQRPLEGHVEADSSARGFLNRAAFYRQHKDEHPWAAPLPPIVPEAVAEVVNRALAIDRDTRYADAGEMLAALDEACQRLGVELDETALASLIPEATLTAEQQHSEPTALLPPTPPPQTLLRPPPDEPTAPPLPAAPPIDDAPTELIEPDELPTPEKHASFDESATVVESAPPAPAVLEAQRQRGAPATDDLPEDPRGLKGAVTSHPAIALAAVVALGAVAFLVFYLLLGE